MAERQHQAMMEDVAWALGKRALDTKAVISKRVD
jgi:hypothetical protein